MKRIFVALFLASIYAGVAGALVSWPLSAKVTSTVVVVAPVYNVLEYGAVMDGDVTKAGANAAAVNAAIAAASNPAAPGSVYIPPSPFGLIVANNVIKVNAANLAIRGDAGMGSNLRNGPTSSIIGYGSGHTLTLTAFAGGSTVSGLEFRSSNQGPMDASVKVEGTAVSLRDLHFWAPRIGILAQSPSNALGEVWLRDILVEGPIGFAGVYADVGNTAIALDHVIVISFDGPPTPYGVLITSAGEVIMGGGCDLIQVGIPLAIIPGLNGKRDQFVLAGKITGCLFDTPVIDSVFICPQSNGYVGNFEFTACWASTFDNGGGEFPANGFYLDGSHSVPPVGKRPISGVSFVNCNAQNFVGHCGWYIKDVYGFDVSHCVANGNFNGIQTYRGVGIVSGNMFGDFVSGVGNAAYGVLLEKSYVAFNPLDNLLLGNVLGAYKVIP